MRQKSKRLGWYWANLNSRVSKDIKTSQRKPGAVVWGRVLKELDLRLPRKVNVNFLIQVEQQIRAAFGRVPTGLNLVPERSEGLLFYRRANFHRVSQ